MPGIPLVVRETSSYTRSADQMCREDSRVRLSAEEEIAAEESLSIYCKPVEVYNILQRRAIRNNFSSDVAIISSKMFALPNPGEAQKKVIISNLMVSVSESVGTVNEGIPAQSPFPLYILLARLVSDVAVAQHSAVYRFSRACILTNFTGVEGSTQVHATFIIPEINKLAWKAKSGSLAILLVNFAGTPNSLCGTDLTRGRLANDGGHCLLGKIPLESLCVMWEKSPNLSLGQRAELSCLNKDKCLSIQMPVNSGASSTKQQVHVTISAEETGAKEKSPYNSYTCNDVSLPTLSRIIRLRAGNVVFNYRYYNNKLQRTEESCKSGKVSFLHMNMIDDYNKKGPMPITEDFSCPFCLVKCGSFKGMRYHLPSSHDLFNFEFWVTEEYQAVNVSVKTDTWRSEVVADGVDPKQQTFIFCEEMDSISIPLEFVHMNSQGGNDFQNASTGVAECAQHVPSSFNVAGVSSAAAQSYTDPECAQSVSGNNLAPPAMLQFAKTRKLSIERSDPRNRTLLQKRQFFHSHRAQFSLCIQNDINILSVFQMLDDFVDVTKDEKQMMHLWNSFVRKQRVLADGHIPWACEAFTKLHGHDLVQAPALIW
ncbi:hypothetical protein JRO89_XS11G0121500 [Xanthoceras sorbifolium]|uniref:Polycomb protein VEFS-Box domain-containing protein n=1 Tax=Xanthoceras sorbifolium TaxID=99658 RepID=A0ABQ8HFE0_9ROSI|nr:hypothetical protein JRO89_XS11G0121500 [Xanthoceras sorbifolium]